MPTNYFALNPYNAAISLQEEGWNGSTPGGSPNGPETLGRKATKKARKAQANAERVDLSNDIRFTQFQADYAKEILGIDIPKSQVKSGSGRHGGTWRDAIDDSIHTIWDQYFDSSDNKYAIHYMFDPASPTPEIRKAAIRASLEEYRLNSCVKFVEVSQSFYESEIRGTGNKSVILVQAKPNDGCWSYVGRVGYFAQFNGSNQQELNFGTWCHHNYIYHHEFYHAAGFLHEQQRFDAGDHIDFKPENWNCEGASMFDDFNWQPLCKKGTSDAGSQCMWEKTPNISPYDHMSIMHYPGDAGGCGSILHYKGSGTHAGSDLNQDVMDRLSTQDLLQINWLYECPLQATLPCRNWRFLAESVFLASRQCDGKNDCYDGFDEENCEVDAAGNLTGNKLTPPAALCADNDRNVQLKGKTFIRSDDDFNGQGYYISQDGSMKLCYEYGDTIGGGRWALMRNNGVVDCDVGCGVYNWAYSEYSRRCPVGLRLFEVVEDAAGNLNWQPGGDELLVQGTADDPEPSPLPDLDCNGEHEEESQCSNACIDSNRCGDTEGCPETCENICVCKTGFRRDADGSCQPCQVTDCPANEELNECAPCNDASCPGVVTPANCAMPGNNAVGGLCAPYITVSGGDWLDGTYKMDQGELLNNKPVWSSVNSNMKIFAAPNGQWRFFDTLVDETAFAFASASDCPTGQDYKVSQNEEWVDVDLVVVPKTGKLLLAV